MIKIKMCDHTVVGKNCLFYCRQNCRKEIKILKLNVNIRHVFNSKMVKIMAVRKEMPMITVMIIMINVFRNCAASHVPEG